MVKVKMIKGRSYRGAVTTDRKNPIAECSLEIADGLVKSGFFSLIGEDSPEADDGGAEEKHISRMNTEELTALAEELGINISACKNNNEKKVLLKDAYEKSKAEEVNDPDASGLPFQQA